MDVSSLWTKLLTSIKNYSQGRNKILFPRIQSKSIGDAIYSSNWTIATLRERRALLFVMIISQKELKLSYYGIFSLALDTFTWVNLP